MHSLLPYNTFQVPTNTHDLITINENTDLSKTLLPYRQIPKLIIGGGSNMLLVHNRAGVAIINQIRGKEIISENDESIIIRLGSGENRHDTVMRSVQQGYRGIENLALIPGTLGASPIQNIGAYGAEVSAVITQVDYYDMDQEKYQILTHAQCQFAYRDSIFKHDLRDIALITSVTIQLSKLPQPILSYGPLAQLESLDSQLTTQRIADEVINIRSSKLPDRTKIGTAGSFFKNPIISQSQLDKLLIQYPECPHRDMIPTPDKLDLIHKIPAGWILDNALGYRGAQDPDSPAGCWHNQALVLVNHGGATGQQIRDRAQHLIHECQSKLGIVLEPEVNII